MISRKFSACGMYAFSAPLQQAWQAFFNHFYALLPNHSQISSELVFSGDETLLRDAQLLLGHTCGYPLTTRLHDILTPFCVPIFDHIAGTENNLYSSHIVVPANSTISSLTQCRGKVATVNTTDSNSGMNLLRYELARLGATPNYFSSVDISGSHFASLNAVADNRAQVAAIDCVSFQLIAEQAPDLVAAVRSIGFTERTCGLPFVMPTNDFSADYAELCIQALNDALAKLDSETVNRLHLTGFTAVDYRDYGTIIELENFAINAGYPVLS